MTPAPTAPTARSAGAPLAVAALLVLMTGCAQQPPKPEIREVRVEVPVQVPVVSPADAAARALLAHAERLRTLQPAELAQEVAPREDALLTPAQAVPLALSLMVSRGNGELMRAQSLLDQVLRGDPNAPGAADWRPLAQLLADRLAEQRRLDDQINPLNQRVRDLQRQLDQANQKLEALKAIERSLGAPRQGTPPTPAPGASGGSAPKQ